MPSDPKTPAKPPAKGTSGARAPDLRQERLARALRDNLKKRKAQQRQRQAPAPDDGADDKPSDG